MNQAVLGRLVVVMVLVAGTCLVGQTATPTAAVADTAAKPIDLAAVTVVHTKKAVIVRFKWKSAFELGPCQGTHGQYCEPYWWGGAVLFDTKPKRKGPELGLEVGYSCGSGYGIGPVVTNPWSSPKIWTVAPDPKWVSSCAEETSTCANTYRLKYGKDGSSLMRVKFRKKRGCFMAKDKVRVSAWFRTGPYGDSESPHDKIDFFPRGNKTYTPWVAIGRAKTVKDKSAGFVETGPSWAP